MYKKKIRNYERGLICESLLGKNLEDARKISGFSGFKIEIFDENSTLFFESSSIIKVRIENDLVVEAK